MNLATYKLLSEEKQFEIIEKYGVLLAEREDSFYHIRLYQIEGFYTEVFCHSHFNVIVRTRCFSSPRLLGPYLKNISLDSLFGL